MVRLGEYAFQEDMGSCHRELAGFEDIVHLLRSRKDKRWPVEVKDS